MRKAPRREQWIFTLGNQGTSEYPPSPAQTSQLLAATMLSHSFWHWNLIHWKQLNQFQSRTGLDGLDMWHDETIWTNMIPRYWETPAIAFLNVKHVKLWPLSRSLLWLGFRPSEFVHPSWPYQVGHDHAHPSSTNCWCLWWDPATLMAF